MTKTKAGPVTRRVRHGAVRHAGVTVDRRRGIIVAEAEEDILAAGPGLPIRLTHLRTTTSDARDATTSDAPDVAVDRVHVADPAREKTAGDASTADPPDPSTSTPSTKRFSSSLC